jgi:hypothetical protein
MTSWYHGTTTAHGDLDGTQCDPRKAGFEPAVWVTGSAKQAMTYAKAACAIHGGDPVVYAVETPDWMVVRSDLDPQTRREYEDIRDAQREDGGADAILFEQGEGAVPMMAILIRCAIFRSV